MAYRGRDLQGEQDRRDRERRTRRLVKGALTWLGVLALVIGGVCGTLWFVAWRNHLAILATLENPTHYRAAAIDLVRLCQTDPKLLRLTRGTVDLDQVPSIRKLGPDAEGLLVRPDFASVTWSPGIQYGWRLARLPDRGGHAATHAWTLSSWYTEDSGDHVLQTFDVPADARLTAADLAAATARPAGR